MGVLMSNKFFKYFKHYVEADQRRAQIALEGNKRKISLAIYTYTLV